MHEVCITISLPELEDCYGRDTSDDTNQDFAFAACRVTKLWALREIICHNEVYS